MFPFVVLYLLVGLIYLRRINMAIPKVDPDGLEKLAAVPWFTAIVSVLFVCLWVPILVVMIWVSLYKRLCK